MLPKIDPRKPAQGDLVHCGSEQHPDQYKTLVLLEVRAADGPIYFVVEGLAQWPRTLDDTIGHSRYFYEEHSCPTNFIPIVMVSRGGDADPHGVFKFVDAVWMTTEFVEVQGEPYDEDEYVQSLFAELQVRK